MTFPAQHAWDTSARFLLVSREWSLWETGWKKLVVATVGILQVSLHGSKLAVVRKSDHSERPRTSENHRKLARQSSKICQCSYTCDSILYTWCAQIYRSKHNATSKAWNGSIGKTLDGNIFEHLGLQSVPQNIVNCEHNCKLTKSINPNHSQDRKVTFVINELNV